MCWHSCNGGRSASRAKCARAGPHGERASVYAYMSALPIHMLLRAYQVKRAYSGACVHMCASSFADAYAR
eukprot:232215-Lingulodinium_polyedra.AAC.1